MIDRALKAIRQYHKLSQADLAKHLSISPSYLSEIEGGKKEPSLDLLHRYADHFKVPLSSLVVFSEALSGGQNRSKARAFISKKMLNVLEWIASNDEVENQKV